MSIINGRWKASFRVCSPKETFEIHPIAKEYPPAENADMRRMRESIAKNGITNPITIYDGKVLDGRTRYQIVKELGLSFPVAEFRGTLREAEEFAWIQNIPRRHIQGSLKAALAVPRVERLMTDGVPQAEARTKVAHEVGVSTDLLRKVHKVKREDKRAFKKMQAGRLSLYSHDKSKRDAIPDTMAGPVVLSQKAAIESVRRALAEISSIATGAKPHYVTSALSEFHAAGRRALASIGKWQEEHTK